MASSRTAMLLVSLLSYIQLPLARSSVTLYQGNAATLALAGELVSRTSVQEGSRPLEPDAPDHDL